MAADAIYLSPHLDDVVLSCGGQIAQQTRLGKRVLVVTVCAGDPPPRSLASVFVQELHARWGVYDPVATRRAEDLASLAVLGAEALHLNVLDCIYRLGPQSGGPLYPDEEALFGAVAEQDKGLIEQIANQLRRLEPLWGAAVYAPLSIGYHVDHQLARAAAERWGAPGGLLAYYEDYPYAEDPSEAGAGLVDSLVPSLVWLDSLDMACKAAAVACHRSQLSTFFDGEAEMARRLAAFASLRAAGAGLAERVWAMEAWLPW
jgi:LmbE family N-acetylglucosaminyl deacetylase